MDWARTGKWSPEETRSVEDTILNSGAKALSLAFGGTPEDWKREQERILSQRALAREEGKERERWQS